MSIPYRVVAIEEPSVIIAASSEHRQEAISAVTFAIDALKGMATIWKKVSYFLVFTDSLYIVFEQWLFL